MHVHILGIGGTFMAGLALLARELGHQVTGSDQKLYPPMSDQLAEAQVAVKEGYHASHLEPAPDLAIIGNALSRGNAEVEAVLARAIPYSSGAQWLAEHVLQAPGRARWTLAVAGTHGKTTTASMLAWILEHAGLAPGFLIGGVPQNFGVSARLGRAPFFVIEADEYDTAFFDKRSKFVHYRPRTAVLNNLEFDHADIFPDLEAIRRQFHHFIRTVPANGLLVVNAGDEELGKTLAMGHWSPIARFSNESEWALRLLKPDASAFAIYAQGREVARVAWPLFGEHNALNALAAVVAAQHAGVAPEKSAEALARFEQVKRRLELRAQLGGISVYDDFAHHPTAIAATLQALRARVGEARILAVLESRSNTMRMGVHRDTLAGALALADLVFMLRPKGVDWNLDRVLIPLGERARAFDTVEELLKALTAELRAGDHVVIMSNGGFEGIHERLLSSLAQGERRNKSA